MLLRCLTLILTSDSSRLCTCGADGIVRLFEVSSKSEVLSRDSADSFV